MKTSYHTARVSLAVVDFVTWMGVAVATAVFVKLLISEQTIQASILAGVTVLVALFEFAATQFARAQIDTADNTAAIMQMMIEDRRRSHEAGSPASLPNPGGRRIEPRIGTPS